MGVLQQTNFFFFSKNSKYSPSELKVLLILTSRMYQNFYNFRHCTVTWVPNYPCRNSVLLKCTAFKVSGKFLVLPCLSLVFDDDDGTGVGIRSADGLSLHVPVPHSGPVALTEHSIIFSSLLSYIS